MSNGFFKIPYPKNEPVLNYAPGSAERKALQDAIAELKSQTADLPRCHAPTAPTKPPFRRVS